MLKLDDDLDDDGDSNGSEETPPYWTVTSYPNISNESELYQQYFKVENRLIISNRRLINPNDLVSSNIVVYM